MCLYSCGTLLRHHLNCCKENCRTFGPRSQGVGTALESNTVKPFVVRQKKRKKREQIKSEKSPDGKRISLALL